MRGLKTWPGERGPSEHGALGGSGQGEELWNIRSPSNPIQTSTAQENTTSKNKYLLYEPHADQVSGMYSRAKTEPKEHRKTELLSADKLGESKVYTVACP